MLDHWVVSRPNAAHGLGVNRSIPTMMGRRHQLDTSDNDEDNDEESRTGLMSLFRRQLQQECEGDDVVPIKTILPEEFEFEFDADEHHRNNREEIRRKLAMGSDNDDYYGGERSSAGRKPSLQTRLQSGMNLQICFMNETVGEQESTAQCEQTPSSRTTTVTGAPVVNASSSGTVDKSIELNAAALDSTSSTEKASAGGFVSRQAKLQAEARMALAQAKQMAHMQMEVEKQRKKKKSPIAEMVGIPFPDGRRKVSRYALCEMNVAQLQVIVNDLHSQIESLNEDLVRMLLDRDDLHMEQDSMLVDIEDLTGYVGAKDQALRDERSDVVKLSTSCQKITKKFLLK